MNALTITWKDLLLLTRDRRALVILVALPMVIIAIVGGATGRLKADGDSRRMGLRIGVKDEDGSELSARLSGFLAAYRDIYVTSIPAGSLPNPEDPAVLRESDMDVVLVIGGDFAERINSLSPRELSSPEAQSVSEGLSNIDLHLYQAQTSDRLVTGLTVALLKLALQKTVLPKVAEKVFGLRGAAADVRDIPEAWASTAEAADQPTAETKIYEYFVPSYTVLFVFFLVNIMGRSFISERDLGTLRRLRISPIRPQAIMVGKTLPFLLVSLVQTCILLMAGKLLFGMSWGTHPWMLFPVMLCTSLAATTLGLLFATIVRTESQVSSLGNLIVLSTAGVSGCLVPRAWMSEFMQTLSLATPHAWALDAYTELLTISEPQLSAVWMCCGMLLCFAGVFFTAGLVRFRSNAAN